MNIFISYRRDDSIVTARLLHNELVARFGADAVFMDLGDIGYGDDFVQAIDSQLERADVVLVVIGPRWAQIVEQRLRGDDWVRHEVAQALRRRAAGKTRVITVLLDGAVWPGPPLPPDMAELQRLSAVALSEKSLLRDLTTLIEAVRGQRFEDEVDELGRGRRARWAALAVGLGVFIAGWVALLDFFGLDTRVASLTMRLADLGGAAPPWGGDVVLVAIDERSEAALGRPFGPDWRADHARLVDQAVRAGARTLAFDMTIAEPGPAEADRALQDAVARALAAMPVVFGVQQGSADAPQLLPGLTAAGAGWGIACAGQRLGLARALPLAMQRDDGGARVPGLALAAYSGGGAIEDWNPTRQWVQVRVEPLGRSVQQTYFDAEQIAHVQPGCGVIPPGAWVASQLFDPATLPPLTGPPQRLAYESLLRGDPATLRALRGRVVLVGVLLRGEDELSLPGGRTRWGAELVALQIDGLLRQDAIRSAGAFLQGLLSVGLGLAGAAVAIALRRRHTAWTLGALLLLAGATALAVMAWYRLERQLVSLPYGWAALALGAVAARFTLQRRST